MDSNEFDGHTFLVTGASTGIGHATARMLLGGGASVVGISRSPCGDLQDSNGDNRYRWVQCDLSDFDSLSRQVSGLLRDQGSLRGAIICHGFGKFGSLENFSPEQICDLVDTNLTSCMLIARLVLPVMKSRGEGDLVFIGSESAMTAGKKGAAYCATKFGLRGFAQSLRSECAASGVRVSMVNPGPVNTGFFRDLDFAPGEDSQNFLEARDVAEAVGTIVCMPAGSVIDEVNLSPQTRVIRGKKPGDPVQG